MLELLSVSAGMFDPGIHGRLGLLQAVSASAETEDCHLQHPGSRHTEEQKALSHLQDWRPQG